MGACHSLCAGDDDGEGEGYVHMPNSKGSHELPYQPPSSASGGGGGAGGGNVRESKAKLARDHAKSTFRPLKNHKDKGRAELQRATLHTLGSGDLNGAVALPPGCSREEWVAVHVLDFYNELALFVGMVGAEGWARTARKGQGFPAAFEYRWPSGRPGEKPRQVSASQYVVKVMDWAGEEIDALPSSQAGFDAGFMPRARDLFKRLFRIYAIIFHAQYDVVERCEALPHLNTCFKHFCFFAFEFEMVEERELQALAQLTQKLRHAYHGT
jgi:MOB kinase activator 1